MKNIAVIGAGLMGHALALVYVLGGHRVRITDIKQDVLLQADIPGKKNTYFL